MEGLAVTLPLGRGNTSEVYNFSNNLMKRRSTSPSLHLTSPTLQNTGKTRNQRVKTPTKASGKRPDTESPQQLEAKAEAAKKRAKDGFGEGDGDWMESDPDRSGVEGSGLEKRRDIEVEFCGKHGLKRRLLFLCCDESCFEGKGACRKRCVSVDF